MPNASSHLGTCVGAAIFRIDTHTINKVGDLLIDG